MADEVNDAELNAAVAERVTGLLAKLDRFRERNKNQPDDDGYDFYPSNHAYGNAQRFMPILEKFPQPNIASAGDNGDVIFGFRSSPKQTPCVRVNFMGLASQRDYIYYDFDNGDRDAVDIEATTLELLLNQLFLKGESEVKG